MFKFRKKKTPIERIQADVKDTVEYAKEKGADIVEALQEAATDVAHDARAKAKTVASDVSHEAKSKTRDARKSAKHTYKDVKEQVVDYAGTAQDKAKDNYKETKERVTDAAERFQDKTKAQVVDYATIAQDTVSDTRNRAVDAGYQAKEDAQHTYERLIAQLAELVNQAQDKSKETYSDAKERVVEGASDLQDKARETYSDTKERVVEGASDLQDKARAKVSDTKERVSDAATHAQEQVKSTVSDATHRAEETVSETKAQAAAAATGAWTSLADAWDSSDVQQKDDGGWKWYHGALLFVGLNALAMGLGWAISKIREKKAPSTRSPETNEEQREYYAEQKLPKFAPPGWVFPLAWTINNISILAGLIRVLNKDKNTPGRDDYLTAQKALWTYYILFNAGYFSLKSPINAAVLTFAYLAAALSNLYVATFRLKDVKVVVSLVTVLAWLGIATPVALLQALWNRDTFYEVGPLLEAPTDMVKDGR